MNESSEKRIIESALHSSQPDIEVVKACRQILLQRIDNVECNDRSVLVSIKDLMEKMEFSVNIKLVQTKDEEPLHRSISQRNNISLVRLFGWGICMFFFPILAILFYLFRFPVMPLLFFLGSNSVSMLEVFNIGKSKEKHAEKTCWNKATLVVASTPEDILRKVNVIFMKLLPLLSMNQLEGKYIAVMEWLQKECYESSDLNYIQSISKLLKIIGFSFVEYDDSIAHFFEQRKANVSKVETTMCAIMNNKTKQCVLRGVVVFPLDNFG